MTSSQGLSARIAVAAAGGLLLAGSAGAAFAVDEVVSARHPAEVR
ncbi:MULTISPECIES: hypothetical protein [Microbacterium]|nr:MULTISPECIES: hypothetical protein [Microbacterium]MDQ1085163.1 hypothetical protein [Microbacterium sp. SORGH_AS_0344]MDQ1169531.1 hypothetical protein [Microbacterium proteolyticum]